METIAEPAVVEAEPDYVSPNDMTEMEDVGTYCMIPPNWSCDDRLEVEIVRVGKYEDEWYVWVDDGDNLDYYPLRKRHGSREAAHAAAKALIAKRDNPEMPEPLVAAYTAAYLEVIPDVDPQALAQRAADLWESWWQADYPLIHEYMSLTHDEWMEHEAAISTPTCKGTCDARADLGHDFARMLAAGELG